MDIHSHVPEGSVPTAGPSAGAALMVALVSAFTGTPVPRDIAMTGEITLRGQILAIGGLKEKALAALRIGVKKIIIPRQNLKDLDDAAEIPANLKRKVEFLPVDNINDLLNLVFPDKKIVMSNQLRRPIRRVKRAPRPSSGPRRGARI
jgi:ATP-dependent Lon protease